MKTFRDAIHGDIAIFPHELIVINTQTYQRLHTIRQLDLAHKIYQDAVHTRFEHLIGATHLADRIWKRLCSRPQMEIWCREYCRDHKDRLAQLSTELTGFRAVDLQDNPAEGKLEVTRYVLRLAALLHDITHIPFGHMLENQLRLFHPHDAGHRMSRFLGKIVLEIFDRFSPSRQEADPYYRAQNVYYLLYLLPEAARVLSQLSGHADTDDDAENTKKEDEPEIAALELPKNLSDEFRWTIDQFKNTEGLNAGELFLSDIIGNTICADLLDYVRRDNYFTGIWDKYDDRIFRAFGLARVKSTEDKQDKEEIRLSIQVIKGKLRQDTISNILRILELRYDLAEKVIFHHARCAAGAMLARAFCLSGLHRKDEQLFYEWGDDEAIRGVEQLALDRKGEPTVDPEAVVLLLSALRGRDFYKPYYRFLRGANEATRSGDVGQPTIGEKLFREFRGFSLSLLRQVEERAGMPSGSVVLYCPSPKMMLKETETIVSGDFDAEIPLGESLKEFVRKRTPVRLKQIQALEERYADLWAATFFVHPAYRGRSLLVKHVTTRLMEAQFGAVPTADPILDDELGKLPTAEDMKERIKMLEDVTVSVSGEMVAAPASLRAQGASDKEALKEDVYTRLSEIVDRHKKKSGPKSTGKAAAKPLGNAKGRSESHTRRGKQLPFKSEDGNPPNSSDE